MNTEQQSRNQPRWTRREDVQYASKVCGWCLTISPANTRERRYRAIMINRRTFVIGTVFAGLLLAIFSAWQQKTLSTSTTLDLELSASDATAVTRGPYLQNGHSDKHRSAVEDRFSHRQPR